MDDLSGAINSFLSQPGAMDQLESMAKQLGLFSAEESKPKQEQQELFSPEILGKVMSAMNDVSGQNEATELLQALKALLRPERQQKVDRAIRAMQLLRAAKTVSSVAEL